MQPNTFSKPTKTKKSKNDSHNSDSDKKKKSKRNKDHEQQKNDKPKTNILQQNDNLSSASSLTYGKLCEKRKKLIEKQIKLDISLCNKYNGNQIKQKNSRSNNQLNQQFSNQKINNQFQNFLSRRNQQLQSVQNQIKQNKKNKLEKTEKKFNSLISRSSGSQNTLNNGKFDQMEVEQMNQVQNRKQPFLLSEPLHKGNKNKLIIPKGNNTEEVTQNRSLHIKQIFNTEKKMTQKRQQQTLQKIREAIQYFLVSQRLEIQQYNLSIYEKINRGMQNIKCYLKKRPEISFDGSICWLNISNDERQFDLKFKQIVEEWDLFIFRGIQSFCPVSKLYLDKVLSLPFQNLCYIRLNISRQKVIQTSKMQYKNGQYWNQMDLSPLKHVQKTLKNLQLVGDKLQKKVIQSLLTCRFENLEDIRFGILELMKEDLFRFLLDNCKQCFQYSEIVLYLFKDEINNQKKYKSLRQILSTYMNDPFYLRVKFHRAVEGEGPRSYEGQNNFDVNHNQNDQESDEQLLKSQKCVGQQNQQQSFSNQIPINNNEAGIINYAKKTNNKSLRKMTKQQNKKKQSIYSKLRQQNNLSQSLSQFAKQFTNLSINQFNQFSQEFFRQLKEASSQAQTLASFWPEIFSFSMGKLEFDNRTKAKMSIFNNQFLNFFEELDKTLLFQILLYYDLKVLKRIFSMNMISLNQLTLCGIENGNQKLIRTSLKKKKVYKGKHMINFLAFNRISEQLQLLQLEGTILTENFLHSFLRLKFPKLYHFQLTFELGYSKSVIKILQENPFGNIPDGCKVLIHLPEADQMQRKIQRRFKKVKRQFQFEYNYEQNAAWLRQEDEESNPSQDITPQQGQKIDTMMEKQANYEDQMEEQFSDDEQRLD